LSNAIYFRNSGWIGNSGGHHDHRTCASMWRCRSCGDGVVVPRSPRPKVGYVVFIVNSCAGA
jgi:hypothetical protein